MARIPLIAGNWKMYKTSAEARTFISELSGLVGPAQRRIFLAVAFPCIEGASAAAAKTKIAIGAQNMHDLPEGAFTGEVSGRMLKASGASFVILGHSERRQYFHETNGFIQRKLQCALIEGLMPILCIGELAEHRESGRQFDVLKTQLEECLRGLDAEQSARITLAYEPVWAIGTGKTATPEIAQAVHRFIRDWLEKRFGMNCAESICIIYGGSVKPDNIASLMQQPDIDGVLVGGASLDPNTFAQIINYKSGT